MDLDQTLVKITPEQLDAFAPLLPASLLPALKAGRAAGVGVLLLDIPCAAAVLVPQSYHVQLLSLYVDPYYRRLGLGSFLIEQTIALLRESRQLFSLTCVPPQTPEVLGFLSACGFSFHDGQSQTLSFLLEELPVSSLFPAKGIRSLDKGHCVSGSELPAGAATDFFRQLSAQGELLTDRSWDDPAVLQGATQYFVCGGKVTGCLLFCRDEAQGVVLDFAYVSQTGRAFPAMLSCAAEYLRANYPPQTQVTLEAVNETSRRLAAKLIPNARKSHCVLAKKPI